ncbi:MAG TPA: diacylglycerol kinase family protein [Sphingomonadaceae bacterium]|nr:diacylglycerol kinase family protein [Sphingomonadaceae bacterium]
MARVALLSNPRSTGNRSLLPRIRAFCAEHPEIFHYEVEDVDQIGEALRTIARVEPSVLVINGGDGTVQAALTELHHGGHFGLVRPPVAVLPNGKTNLIALDLGATGDPLAALARVLEMAKTDLAPHIVARELISLSDGVAGGRSVMGMFLGGAGLADVILYCRHKIYPLGLPNGVSHVLTALALVASLIFGLRARFLPPAASPVRVQVTQQGVQTRRFAWLLVTTLEKMLLSSSVNTGTTKPGSLKLLAVEQGPLPLLRAFYAAVGGKLGRGNIRGVHFESGDEIRIEGRNSSVILDGELFEGGIGRPIILTPTAPVPFLKFAA